MKVIFLDRDGVINEFPGNGQYVTKLKDFRFVPGSLEAIRKLTLAGYTIFVISNQAGVSKGVYSRDKLKRINQKMLRTIKDSGGKVKKVFYCIHKSDEGCHCRKPEIGHVLKSLEIVKQPMEADVRRFFIGDTKSDILTGYRSGCRTILVLSGRSKKDDISRWGVRPDYIVRNLKDAVKIVLNGTTTEKTSAKKSVKRK